MKEYREICSWSILDGEISICINISVENPQQHSLSKQFRWKQKTWQTQTLIFQCIYETNLEELRSLCFFSLRFRKQSCSHYSKLVQLWHENVHLIIFCCLWKIPQEGNGKGKVKKNSSHTGKHLRLNRKLFSNEKLIPTVKVVYNLSLKKELERKNCFGKPRIKVHFYSKWKSSYCKAFNTSLALEAVKYFPKIDTFMSEESKLFLLFVGPFLSKSN